MNTGDQNRPNRSFRETDETRSCVSRAKPRVSTRKQRRALTRHFQLSIKLSPAKHAIALPFTVAYPPLPTVFPFVVSRRETSRLSVRFREKGEQNNSRFVEPLLIKINREKRLPAAAMVVIADVVDEAIVRDEDDILETTMITTIVVIFPSGRKQCHSFLQPRI